MKGVKILGVSHYCPSNVVTNKKLESIVETTDEWIIKRTGIKERRISNGENTLDLAYKASLDALKKSNCKAEEIDLIVLATTSPDRMMPSTACSLQAKLGCKNAAAFDISAACSGFVYALITAESLIKNTDKKKALVVGSEVLSRIVDWNDRGTCVLFGDGAGAMIIEASEDEDSILSKCFLSDGERGENTLKSGSFKLNNPFNKEEIDESQFIEMNGREVFRFAVSTLPEIINKVLEDANESIENIKYIVPHQANLRIIDEAARRLNINKEKFFVNVDKYGNTSAASVPIALSELLESGLINKGDKVIIAAFGGGLTWAGALIKF